MVSSTEGSPTKTCWKRRSRAGSFSMCSRYSSSVVAPTMRSSPRASIGLIMLPASMAESPVAPAPTMVCSSSMKVIDLALGLGDLLQHGLEPLLELAAVLRAGHHRAEVQRHQALALQALGDVAGDDPLGEALDDRRLADAGLADEHRVVLGAAGQHLHDAADLGVAADDRVDLAVAGALGEVDGVLLQRLVGASGSGVVTFRLPRTVRKAASRASRVAPALVSTAAGLAVGAGQPDQQVLGRDVLVAQRAGLLAGGVEGAEELAGRRGRGDGRAADAGQPTQRGVGLRADVGRVGADRGAAAGRRCRRSARAARRAGAAAPARPGRGRRRAAARRRWLPANGW